MKITIMDENGSTLLKSKNTKEIAAGIQRIVGEAGQTVVDGFTDKGKPFGWLVSKEGKKFPFQMN